MISPERSDTSTAASRLWPRLRSALSRGTGPRDPGRRAVLGLTLLFGAELLVLAIAATPSSLSFDAYAFGDVGTNLNDQDLMERGYRPNVDYGYAYGLLPLLFGRAWFPLLGTSPAAYRAAMALFQALMAWGLARFATAARVGPAGVGLLLVAMPYAVFPNYPFLAYALESTLLIHALAEHAHGRRGVALALLTACCLTKPSMAYIYGFLLLLLSLWDIVARGGDRRREILGLVIPPAATGAVLALVLIAVFGVASLARTLLPLTGGEIYRHQGYGFFRGIGRNFWLPPGGRLAYYVGTVAGFWIAGSLFLVAGGLESLWRLARRSPAGGARTVDEVIACCATMHVAFVTLFFAHAWSWAYYSNLLVLGIAAMAGRGGWHARLVWLLAVLALVGHKAQVAATREAWRTTAPAPETAGLWAGAGERAEWARVLEESKSLPPSLVAMAGCTELLFPQFPRPVSHYFHRGLALPDEIGRKAEQIAGASMVVVARGAPTQEHLLEEWPEFLAAMDGCELAWKGKYFEVYHRARPPAKASRVDR
jgi:hypothetical protein